MKEKQQDKVSPTKPTKNDVMQFVNGVFGILDNLQKPNASEVLSSFMKVSIVTVISMILFAIIDSIVAPIARFLLNG